MKPFSQGAGLPLIVCDGSVLFWVIIIICSDVWTLSRLVQSLSFLFDVHRPVRVFTFRFTSLPPPAMYVPLFSVFRLSFGGFYGFERRAGLNV